MAHLSVVSGVGAKGPACFVVDTGETRLMLDLGYGPQPGLWPDVSAVGAIDALLLSHSHRDHAGGLNLLPQIGSPPVHATETVRALIDADAVTLPLNGVTEVCGITVRTGRNGHAPGGVWLHLAVGGGVLYMGDFSSASALYAFDQPPPADTVVLDASYGAYDVGLTACLKHFDAVFDGGAVLFPVPAAGRGPEIALYLSSTGRPLPHIDDAMRMAVRNLLQSHRDCILPSAEPHLVRIAGEAPPIERAEGVMLACVADATSGEAGRLVAEWEGSVEPAIVFTGYVPPGTPAQRLTEAGRARYIRWNVHPTLSDNAQLVRETGARTVVPAFGDARHVAAWESAFAPARVVLDKTVAL